MRNNILSVVLLLILVIIGITSVTTTNTPSSVVSKNLDDSVFSAERAFIHIQEIAKSPHSIGTIEHERVIKYITEECKKYGFRVNVEEATITRRLGWLVVGANVKNIVAQLDGRDAIHRNVLLVAHYDSQPNTYGAADNTSSVATLLETARMFANTPAKNGVILLFSDGEENGLLGAHAFTQMHSLDSVGVVINAEARGNKGSSKMFETNKDNGWVVSNYAKAVNKPDANSMYYEIYKRLSNGTDFSVFKKKNLTGLNNAIVEGYDSYHNMTDSPENIDLNSLQHHGENIALLAKHFASIDLSQTKKPDVTYFNVFSLFFVYPNWVNLLLIIACIGLVATELVIAFRRKKFEKAKMLLGFLLVPIGSLVVYGVISGFLALIFSLYPKYNDILINYNTIYYFIASCSLVVVILVILLRSVSPQVGFFSFIAGTQLFYCCLIVVWFYFMPTSSYMLIFPMLGMAAGQLWMLLKRSDEECVRTLYIVNFLAALPGVILIVPIIYLFYVAFDIKGLFAVSGVLWVILISTMLPLLNMVSKKALLTMSFMVFTIGVVAIYAGHRTSDFSVERPLQTQIRYEFDTDNATAKWVTSRIDYGNRFLFDHATQDEYGMFYIKAQPLNAEPPNFRVVSDTASGATRKIRLQFRNPRRSPGFFVRFSESDSIYSIKINEKQVVDSNFEGLYYGFNFLGADTDGFVVDIEAGKSKLSATIKEMRIGLNELTFFPGYPMEAVPAPGYEWNSILINKAISF